MKKGISRFQLVLIIIIFFLGGYYFGINKINLDWKNFKPVLNVSSKEPPAGIVNVDFSPFWVVWQKLSENYYDKSKLDQQKMLNGAISGMVGALGDPFTLYLPPVQNTNFKQGLAGQFSGIGAELGTKDKDIIVISPLDGSPAEKSGIKAGDVILGVDGQSILGWSLSQTVEKIRGPKGTDVTITVMHKDSKEKKDIKITRDVITVKSVAMDIRNAKCTNSTCTIIPKGDPCTGNDCTQFAYIRLSQFGDNTNQEWLNLVKGISDKLNKNKNIKGVVFDLRNNPGGYLTDATFIASEFIPKGKVVVSEDTGSSKEDLTAQRDGLLLTPKLIVLINKGSASASEIVSGALRDYGRAKLIGETSYGKGTVQAAEDLGDGAGLHVTIAKWLTPLGTWVNGKGLTPDVSVNLDPKNPDVDTQLERAVFELSK
ncbi:MAG TPA: S41 family peptidase [Candidatus Sulfotelmatobacter sp.]|nr:S41 family peptidase [Candidatus Sulfotelmatobacter sp.]